MLLGKSKKALGKLRHRWLRMDADGELCEVTMGKAAIHHKYGVQVSEKRCMSSVNASAGRQIAIYELHPGPFQHGQNVVLLCVQPRDLRLLDAQPSSSPPAVLVRDQAIVINLEFLKCIITTSAESLQEDACADGSKRPMKRSVFATLLVHELAMLQDTTALAQ